MAVSGVPNAVEVLMDALAVTFQGPDGRIWSRDLVGFSSRVNSASGAIFDRSFAMDSSFFKQERGQPVTLRASLYLTLFGNARAKTILLEDTPVNVMDGLQCFNAVFDEMRCRSAFRWPPLLVYAQIQSHTNPLAQFISYSPFPAGISLNGTERILTAGPPQSDRRVTIIVKEPLAHVRRDLEVRGIHLADFAGAAN